jgi:hypothetical protein
MRISPLRIVSAFREYNIKKQSYEFGLAWIAIHFGRLDPGPGGQKLPQKLKTVKKFHVLKCWMFSFED